MGARAVEYELGARVGKYKLGARTGKQKLGPGPINTNWEPGLGPGAKQRTGAREI